MTDDMPLHRRLDSYVAAFAADDEGLTLTPDIWNRLRSDIKEAAMLLGARPEATTIMVDEAPPWTNTAHGMPKAGQDVDLILECGSELMGAHYYGFNDFRWQGKTFSDFTVEYWRPVEEQREPNSESAK